MNKKGFTLIELLAVIVILAILMVIAVPRILDVINGAKTSANNSSIKLLKEGIKLQVAEANMIDATKFTKDITVNEEQCYKFDFDEENQNYQNLDVSNKDQFAGYIIYCDPEFDDTNLSFKDGPGEKNLYTSASDLTGIRDGDGSHSSHEVVYNNHTFWYMWTWDTSTPGAFYYNKKVSVKAGDKLKGKVLVYTNNGGYSSIFKIGLATTNTATDDFVQSQTLNQTFTFDGAQLSDSRFENDQQDIEITVTTPGSYYVKAFLTNGNGCCGSRYAAITELKLERN